LVLQEVKMVRLEGLVRLRGLDLPLLRRAAASVPGAVTDAWPVEVENLLRAAVSRLGGGDLQEAAECTLGLAPGMRDRAAADRRRLAAGVYGLSVERFRKSQEEMVLGQIAEWVCWIADTGNRDAAQAGVMPAPHLQHRTLRMARSGRPLTITLHIHPVELLRDVDVVVSPSNTHLGLPEMYKASVSAALRRAGAVRDAAGDVVEDPVHDGLTAWRREHGVLHRPVLPGTVAPTGAGTLAAQGVRRIYHAAVTVPRLGTNDYEVTPQNVAAAAARALALMSGERDAHTPPLRSVCFPLLGAGRGGLTPETSVSALWTALAADPDRARELHLIVRRPLVADLVADVLGAGRTDPGPPAGAGERKGHGCG
jgi:O-acetyl-ADP-ribose deacetylase (regulator of RNase III)